MFDSNACNPLYRKLLDELLVLNMGKDEKESPKEDDDDAFPSTSAQKGVLQDRYGSDFSS
jgi:hypothetical protein